MKVIFQKIIKNVGKTINTFIPKNRNMIYVQPHVNCKSDKYDLVNHNADNSLKVIDTFIHNYHGDLVTIFLEVYDVSRNKVVMGYIDSVANKSVKVILIESCWNQKNGKSIKNAIRFLKNSLKRYRCKVWVCDTGWSRFWDKTNRQRVINYNYCTPFKRGYIMDHRLSFDYIDYLCQTSMMCAKVVAAEYETCIEKLKIIGFSRNDTLFKTEKIDVIRNWLKRKQIEGKKLIIYVPTYRPELVDFSSLNIFGFENDGRLEELLNKKNAVIVTKLHPLQRKYIAKLPIGCVALEPTYDFTIYDLMCFSSLMVSDYSSISTDYLITKKPVIYLFNDIDKYDTDRGFSFDPIQSVCCGEIAYTYDEILKSLEHALDNPENYITPYLDKIKIWHKYMDSESTRRSYDLLCSVLNE